MCLQDADGMANSVDPDQTAPLEQSDLGLQCLLDLSIRKLRIIMERHVLQNLISALCGQI